MQSLLLVLVLVGDPTGADLAKGLGDEIARLGGSTVRVVVGADAIKELDGRGVKSADLLASPNIGEHLTADGKVLVIHLDRRTTAGDIVVDSRVWMSGHADRHVAIAGKGANPLPGVVSGVTQIINPALPAAAQSAVAKPGDEARLTDLATRQQWQQVLADLAGVAQPSARQCYYAVLSYSRLGQRDAAVEALNRLRLAYPDHFLIQAAAELIPALDTTAGASGDDGGNALRDPTAPAVTDDGSALRDVSKPAPAAEKPASP